MLEIPKSASEQERNVEQEAHVTVDQVTREQWHDLIAGFTDASLYQTWDYDALRWGEHRLSHLVLHRQGQVVAAAQVRVVKAPLIQRGIAYVYGGPMWRRRQTTPDYGILAEVLNALHYEYVVNRKLVLRVVPLEPAHAAEHVLRPLSDHGFFRLKAAKPYQSFLVDLTHAESDLIQDMRPSWRQRLKKAQKRDFTIEIGNSQKLFEEFLRVYDQMYARKRFEERVDVREFAALQSRLPENMKMEITVCRSQTEPLAAAVCGTIGSTSHLLLLATTDEALKLDASHLTVWHAMLSLRARGIPYFDLGGVDPEENPGGYKFKSGVGGKGIFHIGTFEACDNKFSRAITLAGQAMRLCIQKVKSKVKSLRVLLKKAVKQAPQKSQEDQ